MVESDKARGERGVGSGVDDCRTRGRHDDCRPGSTYGGIGFATVNDPAMDGCPNNTEASSDLATDRKYYVNESQPLLPAFSSKSVSAGYASPQLSPTEREWVEHIGWDRWKELEELSHSRSEVKVPSDTKHPAFSWKKLWAFAGPGWLMSIAYVDPGNLESDLQAGAYAQYSLVWVLFWATALGFVLQMLAARIGVVTGKNLAELCRLEYSRPVSLLLWVMTEIAIVGSDIQEVLGSAIAFQILFGLPLWLGCLITALDTVTFLGLHIFGIRKLEAFFFTLIFTMLVCFFINFLDGYYQEQSSLAGLIEGLVIPRVRTYAVVQAVGIIGAVIMPHNIYLHSALVQSRRVDRTREKEVSEANKYFSIEAAIALFVSFLINLAVVGVFAQGFFSEECASQYASTGANSACRPFSKEGGGLGNCQLQNGAQGECREIGLSQAGDALANLLGASAKTVWAIGLLAAGQSSTMTGTYAGQFVMEGFLQLQLPAWKRVGITRAVALVPAITVALINESQPAISDRLDEWLNVLQSVQLPFALLPVLHFSASPRLMGRFANGAAMKTLVWAIALVVLVVNFYLVSSSLQEIVDDETDDDKSPSDASQSVSTHSGAFYALSAVLAFTYLYLLSLLVKEELKAAVHYLCGHFNR